VLTGKTTDLAGTERLQGFQQALTQAGIKPDPGLVRHSGWNLSEAYEAAKTLLAERRDFTAIVAASDMIAMGILRALNEQEMRVPEDISLIGFDDVEFSQYTYPPLTTMRQDFEAMGQGAVQRLMCLIEEMEDTAPFNVPTKLVVRQSTAPAPA
jgi:DNA-binding LacI/PurR family transcriptional regulator